MAIWLITSHKKGIASTALAKDLKITQKSAWFVLHRLRYAARTKSFNKPLKGEIEIDETFVGGKSKNKHASKRRTGGRGPVGSGKVPVMGMLERGGELRAMKIESVKARELQGKVVDHVERGSTIITDEWVGYRGLAMEYTHHKVNHAAGEYVRDKFIHTNSLEGAWSHFKRQVYGVHHWISAKHTDLYVGEFTWRYNRRDEEEEDRVNMLLGDVRGRLRYKDLIGG